MKLLFALVLSLSAPLVCAQTVYTWVDDNGVLHMSDTPNNGAKTVKLPDLEASAPPPQVESTQSLDKPAELVKEKPKSQQQETVPLALTLASPSTMPPFAVIKGSSPFRFKPTVSWTLASNCNWCLMAIATVLHRPQPCGSLKTSTAARTLLPFRPYEAASYCIN